MMNTGPGLTFQPGNQQPAPTSQTPVQQAIQLLSLRLPTQAGPSAIAPQGLLNGAGGMGLGQGGQTPESALMLLQRLLQQSQAAAPPGTPGQQSSFLSNFMTPNLSSSSANGRSGNQSVGTAQARPSFGGLARVVAGERGVSSAPQVRVNPGGGPVDASPVGDGFAPSPGGLIDNGGIRTPVGNGMTPLIPRPDNTFGY